VKTRKQIVKKLDKVFSEYIRKRNANIFGFAECCTCGKKDHYKNLQCGHFMSRRHYSTRWDETNCQVQCPGCNVFKYGEQFKFGIFLNREFGENTAENLYRESKKIVKYTNPELIELINVFSKKIAEVKKIS